MAKVTATREASFLDASRDEQQFLIYRDDYDSFSLASTLVTGAVGATVLTVERSFDGGATWRAMDPALTLTPNGGTTREIDFDAPVVRVRVSTPAGLACRLRITAHLTKDV